MTTSNLLSVPLTLAVLLSAPGALAGESAGRLPHVGNPILPGYYADPSIVTHEGRNFIYATRWLAAPGEREPWLLRDLGAEVDLTQQEIRFEYAWKPSRFRIEATMDGKQWTPVADPTHAPGSGSPVVIKEAVKARFLRLVFPAVEKGSEPGVFEWIAG